MAQNFKRDCYDKKHKKFVKSKVEEGFSVTEATRQMCNHFGVEYSETVGRQYRKKINKGKPPTVEHTDEFKKAKERVHNSEKRRFIISYAQSETAIHEQFFTNLEAYARYIDAEIHVIAGSYKNPTSLEASEAKKNKEKNKNIWHSRVQPYLCASRLDIHKHLTVLGNLKISPTASTPLTGLNGITGLESCIVGHTRTHLKSLPVLPTYPNKLLLTTGALTLPNYTDSKAGFKGEFHHSIGAVVVEVDCDDFHVRQIQADKEGNFCDLWNSVSNNSVVEYKGVPAVVFGDLHLGQECKESVELAFHLVDILDAEEIVLHDVMDGYSVSHHEQRDPFLLAEREEDGSWELKKEIEYMVDWFNQRPDYNFVCVMSNHTDFIDRWVRNNDWRRGANKSLYLELSNVVVKGLAPKGLVPYILDENTQNTTNLSYDESYRIGEWELGLHYDKGANGSRGSVTQFKNLNTKSIGGHGHTPIREDGSIQVGTLTNLKLGYNKGLSSWIRGVVIIYPNGKASHINFINGKFTTLK